MKRKLVLKLVATVTGAMLISSLSFAGDTMEKRYIYSGDSRAIGVCKSIVKDNAIKMRALINREQVERHVNKPLDYLFTCNKLNLYTFAVDMDAKKSQRKLLIMDKNRGLYKKGRVFIDEIAAR